MAANDITALSCYLRLYMCGGQLQKTYLVKPETWDRLETLLDEPLKKSDGYDFFSFDTEDGRAVSFSISDLQMISYSNSAGIRSNAVEPNFSGIRLYFRNALLPVDTTLSDDIEAFFLESVISSTTREEPFFSFLDHAGERHTFNLDHLLIMELSAEQVSQGQLEEMAANDNLSTSVI